MSQLFWAWALETIPDASAILAPYLDKSRIPYLGYAVVYSYAGSRSCFFLLGAESIEDAEGRLAAVKETGHIDNGYYGIVAD